MMQKIIIYISYFFLFSNISFAAEVNTYFNRDCEKVIIKKISEAKKEIRVAIYAFTRFRITRALIEAQQSGIKVEVICDAKQANTEYGDKVIKLLTTQ